MPVGGGMVSKPAPHLKTEETYGNYPGKELPSNIHQSVTEQEAHFQRLSKELEVERQHVANQLEKCRLSSDTPTMNSTSSIIGDSHSWRNPALHDSPGGVSSIHSDVLEDSPDDSKMSSHLLDSCMRALEERGTMNFGYSREMDYGYEADTTIDNPDQYYATVAPNIANMPSNTSFDQYSDHSPASSHLSLQNAGTYKARAAPSQGPRKVINPPELPPTARSSVASLPQEHIEDGYNRYSPARVRGMEAMAPTDSRSSPRPQMASNRAGSVTPTRSNIYHLPTHPTPQNLKTKQPIGNPNSKSVVPPPPPLRQTPATGPGSGPCSTFYAPHRHIAHSKWSRDSDYYNDRSNYHNNAPLIGGNIQYGDLPPYPDAYPNDPAMRHLPYENNAFDNPVHGSVVSPHYRDSPVGDPVIGYANSYRESPYDLRHNNEPPLDKYNKPPAMANNGRYPDDGLDLMYRGSPLHQEPGIPYGVDDPDKRHQGLPPVRVDPFADDLFKDQVQDDALHNGPPELSTFRQTPSPAVGSDRYATNQYGEGPPSYREYDRDKKYGKPELPGDYINDPGHSNTQVGNYKDEEGSYFVDNTIPRRRPDYYNIESSKPPDEESDGLASSSVDGRISPRLRKPDLQEVIDFLGSPNDAIKADSAGYLQHLCFMDDDVKAKTRALGGIPPLIALLNHEIPEVHKNACGALKNLSYGRNNDDNKKAIKNASGVPALTRLLRKSSDEEVKEMVTGVLWNLSSCEDLKKAIIDDSLTVLVMIVMIPHSGWGRQGTAQPQPPPGQLWTTVFRNASGVIRNISSAGYQSRKRLRECDGLVESLIHTVKTAIGQSDIDNKPVENCVCILRNLSYRIQEVDDPDFFKKRTQQRQQKMLEKGENTGCFGGAGKKKNSQKTEMKAKPDPSSHKATPPKGQEILWYPDIVHIYLPLLADCSNPVTLEAAVGAIQNLAACDWQPGVDIRAAVRKEKGLAIIVELLGVESDKVVCAAATALRNLALDQRNKELVGKYAMRQLVLKLPSDNRQSEVTTDDTICAVIATLYEIIKKNPDFAHSLLAEGGVSRLVSITQSEGAFLEKTVRYSAMVLHTMWQFKELSGEYRKQGYTETDFVTKTSTFRTRKMEKTNSNNKIGNNNNTPTSTLNRPVSGQGYDDSTLSPTRPLTKGSVPGTYPPRETPDPNMGWLPKGSICENGSGGGGGSAGSDLHCSNERDPIPLNDMGPGYQTLGDQRSHSKINASSGLDSQAMALNLVNSHGEPLYAQVNKPSVRNTLENSNSPTHNNSSYHFDNSGNADSWV
ncbi:armadillo repeat protein deleted in velo-cardio-facial syndrome-like isoform X1 [Argonauta hians]